MYFFLKKGSVLPTLQMNLIDDGRHDYKKFHEAIQGADITFSMENTSNGMLKVSKGECYIKLREGVGCSEQYVICYDWKSHDTKEAGTYIGTFEIVFSDKLKSDVASYPNGKLVMPIREPLYIIIED